MEKLAQLIQNNEPLILTIFLVIFLIIFLWAIFLQINLNKLKEKGETFFGESKVKNIEDLVLNHSKSLKTLDKDIHELYSISNQINNLAFRSIHKTGLIRFNPFGDVGGDQSFSIALLNGKNNGLVISSLFTREGTRTYSKSIIQGKTEKYPLTQEEEQALKVAIASTSKQV
ncbi:MAG: DUF4446 domain-containing protein [Candidatus Moranbacteria bacterium CG10_big_fil_rev_8_21_14_0_10_35_21]|nr:MAG: DUF4446 domain-containing protein [Candidatus Moranbacteria bacterium CG10_big_fil_rev_8_21_14_0_10_35_21]PJA88826.1 MAG: DUF4446 domain-containing protein [Candidatus Moranbacteria bacterium CG_4_9_14_3_um_filter_36_9]